ncbi:MAG: hypothetical protein WC827_00595 [Candidatus Paceibacterota bacterium]|jgi:hypothetical protein
MGNKNAKLAKVKSFYIAVLRKLQELLNREELMAQFSYLRGIKKKTAKRIIKLGLSESIIPFLPIPSCNKDCGITKAKQLTFIRYKGRSGSFDLDLRGVTDSEEETTEDNKYPHCIVGVDINLYMKGCNADVALMEIKKKGQKPLTLIEVINLAIHRPELLEKHDLLACGSEYNKQKNGTTKHVPCLKLVGETPTVLSVNTKDRNLRQISPSCTERVKVNIIDILLTKVKRRTIKEPRSI